MIKDSHYLFYMRDLTDDVDFSISLPSDKLELNSDHEYIVLDGDISVPEFANIYSLNEFFVSCKENEVSSEVLHILLGALYYFDQVQEVVRSGSYSIVNFTDITKDWYCGHGGDILSPSDKGHVLFLTGHSQLPFEYKEEYESYINWQVLFDESQWYVVNYESNYYLVSVY